MNSTYRKRRSGAKDRGAAVVEFAIALPIFVALLLLVFDAGLGYSASRSSSSAARSAARIGALAGESRDADFRVLDAVLAQYGPNAAADGLGTIIVYRSDPGSTNGAPPSACLSASQDTDTVKCNRYDASILASLNEADFLDTVTLDDGTVTCDDATSLDAAWCPLDRRADVDSFLGVYISSVYDTTTGIEADAFNLKDRAVFAMYFPPLAEAATP